MELWRRSRKIRNRGAADAFPHLYAFGLDAERLKYLLDRLSEASYSATLDIENSCRLLSIAAEQSSKEQET